MPTPTVRHEAEADRPAIRRVLCEAFPSDAEANLVEALRCAGALSVSLVATTDAGEVIGHVGFSPVTIDTGDHRVMAVGLAPVAVAVAHQRVGVAAALIHAGLDALRDRGDRLVVVLGSPAYYPRFGFEPAERFELRWEHDAPPEAFMALALAEDTRCSGGIVRFHPAFAAV